MKYEEVMEQKKGFKVERVNIKEGTMTITVSADWLETVSDAVEKQIPKKPKYNGEKWYRRYFAGVNDEGKPLVFPDGRTSWSNARCSRMWTSYKYIELAEGF